MDEYDVFCHICGQRWSEQDPGVTYHYDSGLWECFDEALCFERRAMADFERSVEK